MWFEKTRNNNENEQMKRVVDILSNCNHLVNVSVNKFIDRRVDYRFLDMLTGYYWQISNKENIITIKAGNVVLTPKNSQELIKMLDIEITKSSVYELQKNNLLIVKK